MHRHKVIPRGSCSPISARWSPLCLFFLISTEPDDFSRSQRLHKRLLKVGRIGAEHTPACFRRAYVAQSSPHSSHTIMSVPSGNDFPRVSNSYVFTVHGTNQAFTLAAGGRLILSTYSPSNQNQIFRCERVTATNRLGFVNTVTNRRILRDQFEDVWARPHNNPSVWESFSFEAVSGGGFRMTNVRYNAEVVIRRVDENGESAYGL